MSSLKNVAKKCYHFVRDIKLCFVKSKEFAINPFIALWYVLKGFSVNECYCYQLNRHNYKEYLTFREGHLPHLINHFGDISGDKLTFSEVFKQFVEVPHNYGFISKGRICALNNSGINNDNFFDFVLNEEVYIKPYNGSDDRGIIHAKGCEGNRVYLRGGYSNTRNLMTIL